MSAMMDSDRKKEKANQGLVLYLLLANGITWLGWISSMVFASREGFILPTIDNMPLILEQGFETRGHAVVSVVFSLAVYGPLLGAATAAWLVHRKQGLRDLWERVALWRIPVRLYVWALMLAILLAGFPALLAGLTGMAVFQSNRVASTLQTAGILLIFQLFTSGLGEEPGWRGYLLPVLRERFNLENTIWLLGLIWAIWHYPFTIYNTLQAVSGVPPAGVALTVVLSLAGQTMSLIGITYLYVWLYNETGSVFLSIVFHALTNTINAVVFASMEGEMTILVALMPWVLVLILQKVLGKERFPGGLSV